MSQFSKKFYLLISFSFFYGSLFASEIPMVQVAPGVKMAAHLVNQKYQPIRKSYDQASDQPHDHKDDVFAEKLYRYDIKDIFLWYKLISQLNLNARDVVSPSLHLIDDSSFWKWTFPFTLTLVLSPRIVKANRDSGTLDACIKEQLPLLRSGDEVKSLLPETSEQIVEQEPLKIPLVPICFGTSVAQPVKTLPRNFLASYDYSYGENYRGTPYRYGQTIPYKQGFTIEERHLVEYVETSSLGEPFYKFVDGIDIKCTKKRPLRTRTVFVDVLSNDHYECLKRVLLCHRERIFNMLKREKQNCENINYLARADRSVFFLSKQNMILRASVALERAKRSKRSGERQDTPLLEQITWNFMNQMNLFNSLDSSETLSAHQIARTIEVAFQEKLVKFLAALEAEIDYSQKREERLKISNTQRVKKLQEFSKLYLDQVRAEVYKIVMGGHLRDDATWSTNPGPLTVLNSIGVIGQQSLNIKQ